METIYESGTATIEEGEDLGWKQKKSPQMQYGGWGWEMSSRMQIPRIKGKSSESCQIPEKNCEIRFLRTVCRLSCGMCWVHSGALRVLFHSMHPSSYGISSLCSPSSIDIALLYREKFCCSFAKTPDLKLSPLHRWRWAAVNLPCYLCMTNITFFTKGDFF